jgi:hypothetical protein
MDEARVPFLIRIRPSLKSRLTELAKAEHRSLNQQIEFLLEGSIQSGREIADVPGELQPKRQGKKRSR